MSKLYIIGNSTTADEICHFVERYKLYDIGGFAINKRFITERTFNGYPLYAIEELDQVVDKEADVLFVAIFWNRLNQLRRDLYENLKSQGYRFATLISPTAEINNSIIGENCWIADGVYIKPNNIVGDNTFIDSCACVGINTKIGSHCFVAFRAVIAGSCVVGNQTFVGINATVFDHTIVGDKCIVGSCAFVKRNLESYCVAKTSSDSTIVRKYSEEEIVEKLVVQKNVR